MSKSGSEKAMGEAGVPNSPRSAAEKSRLRLIAVVNESCTGCEVCVDFCPVDCIDDVPPADSVAELIPLIRIREPECIGCQICAKVCEELSWNAIEMIPLDEFRRRSGLHAGAPTAAVPSVA